MLGRLISGFVSNRLGDRLLIRIGIMPFYLLIFAALNIGMLERTYVVLRNQKV